MAVTRRISLFLTEYLKKTSIIQVKNVHSHRNLFAKVAFNLSDIGEGIREVVVKEWYVKEGDKVSQFDNICEVQSDKASVTITSRYDGIISKLHYKEDDTALVGKPLVDIETEDGASAAKSDSSSTSNDEKPPQTEKQSEPQEELVNYDSTNSDIQCIPSVRRLAKEHNIDLRKINGSGKHGRILKEDVLNYLNEPLTQTLPNNPIVQKNIIEPIQGFKKVMIRTMTESLKIPHFVYGDEIILTELSKLRDTLKTKHNTKISSLPFFVKAASNALAKHTVINSSVDENVENIIYHKDHNIGIAMDTVVGLAVPVIKNVQELSILEINQEIQRLIKNGREGKFLPDDLKGGTFTISNIGTIGGTHLHPVILPPQAAIFAMGMSRLLPRFNQNQMVVAEEIVSISASGDHRIIDGVTMAKFCTDIKRQLENPYLLFLKL